MAFQMNDMTKPVKDRLGFDPASVKKLTFGELVKKIGPGIILTGIVIGPGNITTSAMMGANYGYKMLWLLIPIILMGITFMLSSYRISIMTGLPILHAIRHYYGGIASGFCGVALFLSCFFFTLGNITGTGAGMNLIFGFDWRIGSLIMLAILAFCYLTKGVYSKVEKGIMICICGMIIAFFATLIATGGPNWGQVGHGLTHPTLPEGFLATALAYISTNAAVTAGIYGTYLGLEKKWNKQDLFNGTMVADAYRDSRSDLRFHRSGRRDRPSSGWDRNQGPGTAWRPSPPVPRKCSSDRHGCRDHRRGLLVSARQYAARRCPSERRYQQGDRA